MSGWFESRRVCVTGGEGFIGRRLVARLRAAGCRKVFAAPHSQYELTRVEDVERLYQDARPQVVIHLAARVGGIGEYSAEPGCFFFENLMMGALVIDAARRRGVEKVVLVGTASSYPKDAQVPFREEDLWAGYPDEACESYAVAKRALFTQARTYRQQYGLNTICLIPTNVYGPGANFNTITAHVVPSLVAKFLGAVESGEPSVVCWGTGRVSREFLYVDDAVEGITLAAEHYEGAMPVNLGSGHEITVRELALLIAKETGFGGEIRWDTSRPDGPARRSLDVSRATELFGFRAQTELAEGIRRTIDWYRGALRHSAVAV